MNSKGMDNFLVEGAFIMTIRLLKLFTCYSGCQETISQMHYHIPVVSFMNPP